MATRTFKKTVAEFQILSPRGTLISFDELIRNLNTEFKKIENLSEFGMVKAMTVIRIKTESESPATPVDVGNLRASWFIASKDGSEEDILGYSGKFRKNPRHKELNPAELKTKHDAIVNAAVSECKSSAYPVVFAGYTVPYALWVHEMIGARFKRTTPPAGPKWFEYHINKNQKLIFDIVANYSKLEAAHEGTK